jgi:hypothetical protein
VRCVQVRFLLLAAVSLLSACGELPDTDPRVLLGPLTIDREFSARQRMDIRDAVEIWAQATGERFAPRVQVGEVSCGQAFAIEAVHDESCHIGQEVRDGDEDRDDAELHTDGTRRGGQRVLGAAHPEQHWISVVTWLEGDAFRNNVAHELGHYLLVGHGEGIMAQARKHEPAYVAPASISEFCAIWSCPDASKAAE